MNAQKMNEKIASQAVAFLMSAYEAGAQTGASLRVGMEFLGASPEWDKIARAWGHSEEARHCFISGFLDKLPRQIMTTREGTIIAINVN